ncbi:hypothetical protein HPB50_008747 [Hyalomma asiaticum]|uniref:Uncharacterized protein n=1 Tax=Hyalomma asiaticum TaxID=266040 RepID=A0ACB7T586_HYAAI|nr:hypothetical protein HPB50_008747 [Hyalomma asiaticum]
MGVVVILTKNTNVTGRPKSDGIAAVVMMAKQDYTTSRIKTSKTTAIGVIKSSSSSSSNRSIDLQAGLGPASNKEQYYETAGNRSYYYHFVCHAFGIVVLGRGLGHVVLLVVAHQDVDSRIACLRGLAREVDSPKQTRDRFFLSWKRDRQNKPELPEK